MNDLQHQNNDQFIILGDDKVISELAAENRLEELLSKENKKNVDLFWGTLGWKNDRPFSYSVDNSMRGNESIEERDNLTSQLVDELRSINTEIGDSENGVLDRYINLDNANFDIDWSEIHRPGWDPK